ncbi:MAG: MGH1-like glycoside hydrolase domain-containing protein [Bacteroidota bacterium]|jgi:hypothetical protein
MNAAGKLFQSSIELTDDQLLIFKSEPYFAPFFFLLGGSKLPLEKAESILNTLFESQKEDGRMALSIKGIETPFIQAPLHAGIIWQYAQEIEDKKIARTFIKKYFEKLVHSHLYWYERRDFEEDGLVSIVHPVESLLPESCSWDESLQAWKKRTLSTEDNLSTALFNIQKDLLISSQKPEKEWAMKDPVVNSLLCWSNEALIAMGKFIRKNVSEIIQWNELALYSMNEQLWDEEYGIYRGYDLITKELPLSGSIGGLLPLLAGIPVQEQAEAMLGALRLNFEKPDFYKLASNSLFADVTQVEKPCRGAMSLLINWLLFQGLSRFDLIDFAEQIKKDTIALVSEYGYYLHYSPQKDLVQNCGIGKGNNPFAVAILLHFIHTDATFYQETSEDPV